MFDDVKDLFKGSSGQAAGKWVDGKFIPNDQLQQEESQQPQQPQQSGQFVPQPVQESMYQQPQQPMQQQMYQQPQQPMQQMYQQPQQPMQQQMYQQPQQPMYQQPQQPMQQMYQQPVQQPAQKSAAAGEWVNGKWVPNADAQQESQQSGMKCPKCKSNNVVVQLVEVGSSTKTKKSGVGLGGHTHNAVRGVMAVGTLGMSNLVIKKATGTEKSKGKTKTKPFCVCQNCGNTWKA